LKKMMRSRTPVREAAGGDATGNESAGKGGTTKSTKITKRRLIDRPGCPEQPRAMQSLVWIYAAAGYNVALAAFHLGFWRLFRWKEELAKLHPVNRGVVQVMNLMLVAFLLLMASVQVLNAAELTATALGRLLMAGVTGLWLLRAVLQPVFWPSAPKGVNAALISLFVLGAGLHAVAFGGS